MDRIILTAILILFFNNDATARPSPFSRYYSRVPESEAHTYSGQGIDQALNPKSIKALIWNIKKASMPAWQNEFKTYASEKDLLLIQEAFETELFKSTLDEFKNVRWDLGISFLYRLMNNTATGSMIGSEVNPTSVIIKQTTRFEPIIRTPKAMTMAKYPIEGHDKEILVISIHAINFTGFTSFKSQLNQAALEINKHDGPILFAGDFNTHHAKRTNYLMKLIKKLGLQMINFKNAERRMKFAGHYLDHGFIRGLEVKNAEVYGDSRGSDHKPMVLELALTTTPMVNEIE